MWKIEDPNSDYRYAKDLMAIIAIAVFIFAVIFFIMFVIKTINGELTLEDGFYRCMAVIGMFFLVYTGLGLILKVIEKDE